jgi:hypothetical protein
MFHYEGSTEINFPKKYNHFEDAVGGGNPRTICRFVYVLFYINNLRFLL